FWYWRLTPYGLAWMRLLVRCSIGGFSYFETFLEPDPGAIPQLVLLAELNAALTAEFSGHRDPIDWAAILDRSPYLHAQHASIDPAAFGQAIETLKVRIQTGCFEMSGVRSLHYRPAR
ncbi:MAG: hypothetical protein K8J31_18200, partial [Anaerolineae bacterium]|nr:hypothetical protein [Anaerolineae bacterium]